MRFNSTPFGAVVALCLLLGSAAARAETAALPVEGGTLAYQTCGEGSRTIVLLHDGILHSAAYDDVWPRLCECYRVIRYDRRGYGASTPSAQPYTAAKDLEKLLAATGTTRAILVGSSAGGGLAVDYTLAHPEAVEGLVVVGPWVAGFNPSAGFIARNLKLMALFKSGAIESAAKDRYILAPDAEAERARVVAWLRAYPGNVGAARAERFMTDARPRLGEIRAPTLVLVGEIDIDDVRRQAAEVARRVPDARQEIVPNAGHFLYLEKPDDFARRIEAFVDALPNGQTPQDAARD